MSGAPVKDVIALHTENMRDLDREASKSRAVTSEEGKNSPKILPCSLSSVRRCGMRLLTYEHCSGPIKMSAMMTFD